jgi:hypothetical protein
MVKELEKLSEEEKQLVYDAPPLVALLIAGADGEIDVKEKEWSKKLTHIRSYTHKNSFGEFFEKLDEIYGQKLDNFIEEFPRDVHARIKAISQRLSGLNPIFAKIDPIFAHDFIEELKSFAHHIARASGGFFRVGSISKAESDLLDLPMIDPIP